MRKLLLIGIGAGHSEHLTTQAIKALNTVDVFFAIDKGGEKDELSRLRREICQTHIRNRPYRTVAAVDPERDRAPASYAIAVEDWHRQRAALFGHSRQVATQIDLLGQQSLARGGVSLADRLQHQPAYLVALRVRRTLSREEGRDLILRAYMSEDFREGMDAFLNKRTPNWKGK